MDSKIQTSVNSKLFFDQNYNANVKKNYTNLFKFVSTSVEVENIDINPASNVENVDFKIDISLDTLADPDSLLYDEKAYLYFLEEYQQLDMDAGSSGNLTPEQEERKKFLEECLSYYLTGEVRINLYEKYKNEWQQIHLDIASGNPTPEQEKRLNYLERQMEAYAPKSDYHISILYTREFYRICEAIENGTITPEQENILAKIIKEMNSLCMSTHPALNVYYDKYDDLRSAMYNKYFEEWQQIHLDIASGNPTPEQEKRLNFLDKLLFLFAPVSDEQKEALKEVQSIKEERELMLEIEKYPNLEFKGIVSTEIYEGIPKIDVYEVYDNENGITIYIQSNTYGIHRSDELFKALYHAKEMGLAQNLKKIVMSDFSSPSDDYWSQVYGESFTSAACANDNQIWFWGNCSDTNIKNVLFHESAHCYDIDDSGYQISDSEAWINAVIADGNWASSYAQESYEAKDEGRYCEDFADSVENLEKMGAEEFSKNYPNRAEVLKTLLPKYFK